MIINNFAAIISALVFSLLFHFQPSAITLQRVLILNGEVIFSVEKPMQDQSRSRILTEKGGAQIWDAQFSDTEDMNGKDSDMSDQELQPSDEQSIDGRTSDAAAADAKSTDMKSTDMKNPEAQSSDPKTSDARTSDAKASEAKTSEEKDSIHKDCPPAVTTAREFRRDGVRYWNGWRWTWYSERVLPGGGLKIPGRHTDEDGFVCDEDGYICLASEALEEGTVIDTIFGRKGKIYDCGCNYDTIDVYVNW